MLAWLRSVGWGVTAIGLGWAVLGLSGDDELLGGVERQLRQGVVRGVLRAGIDMNSGVIWDGAGEGGPSLVWQEEETMDGGWRWSGWQPQPRTLVPTTLLHFDEQKSAQFGRADMGPLDFAGMLRELRGDAPRAVLLPRPPMSWQQAEGVYWSALERELDWHPRVVFGAAVEQMEVPLLHESLAMNVLEDLGEVPKGMELEEVNAARFAWPMGTEVAVLVAATLPQEMIFEDGGLVRLPLLVREQGRVLPVLPLALALESMEARPQEIVLGEDRVLRVGQRWQVRLDDRGRMAIPLQERDLALGAWQEGGWYELMGTVDLEQESASEREGLEVGERVVWMGGELARGGQDRLWARATASLLNADWGVREFRLRPGVFYGAAWVVVVACLMAGRLMPSTLSGKAMVALGVLGLSAMASWAAVALVGVWLSPLPVLMVVLVMLVAGLLTREQDLRVSAVKDGALAGEQKLQQALQQGAQSANKRPNSKRSDEQKPDKTELKRGDEEEKAQRVVEEKRQRTADKGDAGERVEQVREQRHDVDAEKMKAEKEAKTVKKRSQEKDGKAEKGRISEPARQQKTGGKKAPQDKGGLGNRAGAAAHTRQGAVRAGDQQVAASRRGRGKQRNSKPVITDSDRAKAAAKRSAQAGPKRAPETVEKSRFKKKAEARKAEGGRVDGKDDSAASEKAEATAKRVGGAQNKVLARPRKQSPKPQDGDDVVRKESPKPQDADDVVRKQSSKPQAARGVGVESKMADSQSMAMEAADSVKKKRSQKRKKVGATDAPVTKDKKAVGGDAGEEVTAKKAAEQTQQQASNADKTKAGAGRKKVGEHKQGGIRVRIATKDDEQ